MGQAKVIHLDEYRKARQYRSLLRMIEGHLAEAGLLAKDFCVDCGTCRDADSEECAQLLSAEGAGEQDL